ncbi:hypothetical protein T439DRAFT_320285 [Meredithblackwellia eburnea MCA 4105]
MPLLFSSIPEQNPEQVLATLPKGPEEHYLLFSSSLEERGRPWCRDCEAAQGPLAAVIPDNASSIVYVGDRETWNKPENPWKQAPFNIERIPTILKLKGEGSIEDKITRANRLVEAEILEGSILRAFIKS